MKTLTAAAFAATLGLAGPAAPSQAMPLGPLAASDLVTTVAGGCGPGWHPNPWGRCVPNRWGAPVYGFGPAYGYGFAPPVVVRRTCPPGFHLGPYGGRCWPNRW